MRTTIALLFILAAQGAGAGVYADKDGSRWYMTDPPERWFSEPAPSEINIHIIAREDAIAVCKLATGKSGQPACAERFPWADICDITVAEDLPDRHREAVIRHELAHCHGWGADHALD